MRAITEREMLLDWGKAETYREDSARHMSPDLVAMVRGNLTMTAADEDRLVNEIRRIRDPMLADVLWHVGWFAHEFPVEEIGAVRTARASEFVGVKTIGEVATRRPKIAKRNFAEAEAVGRPVFIGPTANGPWLLIEGTHRCAGYLRLHAAGELKAKVIQVILGIGSHANRSRWW